MSPTSDPSPRWDGPPIDAWDPWTPGQIAERLEGLDIDWCVVGGWALDLALDRSTRPHDDLEIAVLEPDLAAIRQRLGRHVFHAVHRGEVHRLGPTEEPPSHVHQHWVLDPTTDRWRADVMTEPGDVHTWVYRRDPALQEPRLSMIATTTDGIPYLRLHGVLLYKAEDPRPKDERDFDASVDALTDDERRWLHDVVARRHPDHRWLARLAG